MPVPNLKELASIHAALHSAGAVFIHPGDNPNLELWTLPFPAGSVTGDSLHILILKHDRGFNLWTQFCPHSDDVGLVEAIRDVAHTGRTPAMIARHVQFNRDIETLRPLFDEPNLPDIIHLLADVRRKQLASTPSPTGVGEGRGEGSTTATTVRESMQGIGDAIKSRIPAHFGFFTFVFPFGTTDGLSNYVSNAKREEVLLVMKEFILKAGAAEDWMQHIN